MITFAQFVVIGMGMGAIYALLAQGVVVVYRASGVVNFAQGATAVMVGFGFATLTKNFDWSPAGAFGLLILLAAGFGAIIYWIGIRPLRGASQLTQVMVTLAFLLILQALAVLQWKSNTITVSTYLSTRLWVFAGVSIQATNVVLLAIAVALTAALWAFGRFTLPGLAISGSSENRRAVAALGWSPDALAVSSWAVGSALGGVAGLLIAPITGVQVNNMTLLLVSTLAAALVGGFTSFPITLVGALAIGVGQALIANYVVGITGAGDAFPFLVIVVVLFIRGKGVTARGGFSERMADIGSAGLHARFLVPAGAVMSILLLGFFGTALIGAVTTTLMIAIVCLSIVVLSGYTGQLSLAQMSIGGIAALVAARLVSSVGWNFLPAAAVGVLAAIPVGLIFAVPALRTRGLMLAIITFGLGSAVSATVFANGDLVGGEAGTPVGPQTLFGFSVDTATHADRYAVMVVVAFVLCAWAVSNIRRGQVGRRLVAVRSNERAAAALGINVYGIKMYAFGLSAAIAAVGGILIAFQYPIVQYDAFSPFKSLQVLSYSVIGGLGHIAGALYGALLADGGIFSFITRQLGTGVQRYLPLIGGIGLLVMLLQNPNGLASTMSRLAVKLRHRSGRVAAPVALPKVDAVTVRPATLEISGLTVRFGGVVAAQSISLALEPGRIMGLIGPNGAGKTTVIDAVTGLVPMSAGTITLDGVDITRLPTHKRIRAGLSRSFQMLELFESVTVRENLLAASEPQNWQPYVTDLFRPKARELSPAAVAAVHEFGLAEDLDRCPAELSYGRRRMVAIARAIAAQPSILLLDEPAAGLDEAQALEISTLVRRLATNWGIAVLLIEHDVNFVMSVCDEITVVEFGRQIAQGTPQDVRADPAVIAAYLGPPVDENDNLSIQEVGL